MERLGCGDVEWLRGAAWAFVQAAGLIWYYELTNPVMHDLGVSTMSRLLADTEIQQLGNPDPGVRGDVRARGT